MEWFNNLVGSFSTTPSTITNTTTTTTSENNSTTNLVTVPVLEREEDADVLLTLTNLLKPFQGNELPIQARTDPSIQQTPFKPLTLTTFYQYFPFFSSQTTVLSKALIKHVIEGPPRKSWNLEMTLFTSFLREAGNFSHLSSIEQLRSVLDLSSFLPTPKDGIITPIAFLVKQRGLKGFLAHADSIEDGTREITGEWVINKKLWKKMQENFSATSTNKKNGEGGNTRNSLNGKNKQVEENVKVAESTIKEIIILYLHGGCYFGFSSATHRFITIPLSRYTESRVFAINYRLAPESRFPCQLHDAVSAYLRLTIDLKIPSENIIMVGDSAGGNLVLATMMYLRDEGYPLPSSAILMSPWVDLSMSCESWTTNAQYDYLPMPRADDALHPVKCLLGEDIHTYLTHPYVSPLFGDMKGLPPLLIQAGEAEVLRDEITLLAHKATLAGVSVTHEIYEDQVHVFQTFTFLDASRKAFQSQRKFVRSTLPELLRQKKREAVGTQDESGDNDTSKEGGDEITEATHLNCTEIDREIKHDAHMVGNDGKTELESLPSSPTFGDLNLPTMDHNTKKVEEKTRVGSTTLAVDIEQEDNGSDLDLEITPTSTPPSRPSLRAYSSYRELIMSQSEALCGAASTSHGNSGNSSGEGVGVGVGVGVGGETLPSLHSKSSSHPDLRAILIDYESTGPANTTTRIFNPTSPSSSIRSSTSSDGKVKVAKSTSSSNASPAATVRKVSFDLDKVGEC